jgi:hypothetical protein
MKFKSSFIVLKATSLGLRALVFFLVLAFSNKVFGANQLMAFVSLVTIAGVILGFGATDSVVVCSMRQYEFVSHKVFLGNLIGMAAASLVLFDIYWLNLVIACLNFGLLQWNLGLVRRKNPVLFEWISNFQMLIFWIIYLLLLSIETSNFIILCMLYIAFNGVLAAIVYFMNSEMILNRTSNAFSLIKVSTVKLTWQINYSCLTRMIFILPNLSVSMHAAFSYAYLLFEMTSAMLSHYQTVFLRSNLVDTQTWIRLSILLLTINAGLLISLLILMQIPFFLSEYLPQQLVGRLEWMIHELDQGDINGLVAFMLGITILQSADYGRYALKLEGDQFFAIFSTVVTVLSILTILIIGNQLSLLVPFVFMFFAGLLFVTIIYCNRAR